MSEGSLMKIIMARTGARIKQAKIIKSVSKTFGKGKEYLNSKINA